MGEAALTFNETRLADVRQYRVGLADVAGDGSSDGRDIVGSNGAAALAVMSDGVNIYFRMRLDSDPRNAAVLRPYAWGVLIDTDDNLAAYEYSVIVDATSTAQIVVARNTTPGTTGDPTDLSDTVLTNIAVDLTASGNVNISAAGDSSFSGNTDYFLDFAVALNVLLPNGLTLNDSLRFVAGVSTSGRALTTDIAGTNSAPAAGGITLGASDPVQLDGLDADADLDGISNDFDLDDDQDGISDRFENVARFDPGSDRDSDGVPNWRDANDRGDGLAATCLDIATDGVCDVPASIYDQDGDGVPNHLDLDSDNDGIGDVDETAHSALDANNDGLIDGVAGTNGLIDALETVAGSGLLNFVVLNTDGDALPDFLDLDSDADGTFDLSEIGQAALDVNSDGVIDTVVDLDFDGVAASVDASASIFGFTSIRVRTFDADLDSIPNPYDAESSLILLNDSDHDLLLDTLECLLGWPCPDGDSNGTPDYMTPLLDSAAPSVFISSIAPNPTSAGANLTWYGSESGTFAVRSGGSSCADGTVLTSGAYTAPAVQTTALTSANLSVGSNTIRVCLTDAATNVGNATTTVLKDTMTNPLVIIASASANPTAAGSTINWSANDAGTFSVRVGGTTCATGTQVSSGAYTAFANQATVIAGASFASGANTVRVCLTNASARSGSATLSVIQDAVAPSVSITSVTPSPTAAAATVTFTAAEAGTYSLRVGGTTCANGTQIASGSISLGVPVSVLIPSLSLALGANTIRACVADALGNSGSTTQSLTKNLTAAPVAFITSTSPSPTNAGATVRWYGNDAGSFTVRVGGTNCTNGTVVVSSTLYLIAGGEIASAIPAANLATGSNTVRVCLGNLNGTTGTTTTIVKDSTAPSVSIVSVSPTPTSAGTTVTWSSTESGTFELRVGGTDCSTGSVVESGSYGGGNLATPVISTALAYGTNTLRVCFTDVGGNTASASSTVFRNYPPAVSIVSATPNPTSAGTTLSWSSDQSGTYSVRIGGSSCSNGTELATAAYTTPAMIDTVVSAGSLAAGANTLRVCVTNANGTGSATQSVSQDLTAPIVSIASATSPTNNNSTVNWSATEAGTYSVRSGGTSCSNGTVVSSGAYVSGNQATTVLRANMSEGSNTIRVCFADAAGNTGSATTTVLLDTTPPTVSILHLIELPGLIFAELNWDASENGSYTIRLGAGTCSAGLVIGSGQYVVGQVEALAVLVASLLSNGYLARVCVTDAAGNTGGDDETYVPDTTAPVVTIDSIAPSPTAAGTTLTWSGNESGNFTVRAGGSDCSTGTVLESGAYVTGASHQTVIAAGSLAEGANNLRVCLTDSSANTGNATGSVTKDSTPPVPSIVSLTPNPTLAGSSLDFSANESGTYSVRLGGTTCANGTQIQSGSYTTPAVITAAIDVSLLSLGTTAVRVCVTDALGNVGSTASSVLRTTEPVITIDCDALGPTNNSEPLSFRSDKAGAFSVRLASTNCSDGTVLDSGNIQAAMTQETEISTAGLVDGTNHLRVCVLDTHGFSKSAEATIVYRTPFYRDLSVGTAQRTFSSPAAQYHSTLTIGDLNGDGIADLVTAEWDGRASASNTAINRAGTLYGWTGGAGFFNSSATAAPTGAMFQIRGGDLDDSLGARTGRMFAGVDVTGDGIGDLVVSAPYADGTGNARRDAGEIYVFTGGPTLSGAMAITGDIMPPAVHSRIIGPSAGGLSTILGVRDANGDGIADLLIGVPGADPNGLADAGEVYLLEGGSAIAGTVDLATAPRMAYFSGAEAGDTIGIAAALGDFGGSPNVDIVIGARSNGGNGGAYGVFGPLGGDHALASLTADVRWVSVGPWKLGQAVTIANVRGDAREDVILTGGRMRAPSAIATGGANIFTGPIAAGTINVDVGAYGNADSTIVGADDDDRFGATVVPHDFDGDGYDDLMFSTNASDGAGNAFDSAGSAVVTFGAQCLRRMESLATDSPSYLVDGPGASVHLGRFYSSTGAGDLDADGKPDFCIGGERLNGGNVYCFSSPW